MSRSIVSRSAVRATRSSALPRAHCCISGSSSRALYRSRGVSRAPLAVLQALSTAPMFEHTALTHEPTLRSTRKIDGVHRNHTRLALGALSETSTVESVVTQPDIVAQNPFTANKTHASDTTRCSVRQCKACSSQDLASLIFRSNSSNPATNTSERYCPVS